jgi:VIT1/CCC1 family predicted Fe2+/Mn2+ transporter
MDGLLSNSSLIAGIAGGSAAAGVAGKDLHTTLILAGFAGLVGGAFSMGAGEYISVATQSESIMAEIEAERLELEIHPEGELKELAHIYEAKGLSPELAHEVAVAISKDPERALAVHVQEEMGVSVENLPSAWVAGISSFIAFTVGALIPLIPYMFGAQSQSPAIALTALALFLSGAVVSRVTTKSWWFNGARQLIVGAAAGVITYILGNLVGGVV